MTKLSNAVCPWIRVSYFYTKYNVQIQQDQLKAGSLGYSEVLGVNIFRF